MIRQDHRPRLLKQQNLNKKMRERLDAGQNRNSNTSKHIFSEHDSGVGLASVRQLLQKQNKPAIQNTPKQSQFDKDYDDVEQLSQIQFISKEFSSIKEKNHSNRISFANSANNLDEFSPLFDKLQASEKEDFTLEICGIDQSECSFETNFQKDGKKTDLRGGKIKRNRNKVSAQDNSKQTNQRLLSQQRGSSIQIQSQIAQIFKCLDHQNKGILSKSNCSSQKITTELSYLIGSILNKIKSKDKMYSKAQFQAQFKNMVQDSEREELIEILKNNRKKMDKLINFQKIKGVPAEPVSPCFKSSAIHIREGVADKLTKISDKLNYYLAKNQLLDIHKLKLQMKESNASKIEVKQTQREDEDLLKLSATTRCKHSLCSSNCVGSTQNETIKSEASLRSDVEVIKGIEGSSFQLVFLELNKHLD